MTDIVAMVLVGAFWGCTNPLLRQGSSKAEPSSSVAESDSPVSSLTQRITKALTKFRHVGVWLPYLVNQSGSILYYYTLSQSDLSLAVPICNALALLFSIATAYVLGEPFSHPLQTTLGSALIMGGVAVCLVAREQVENGAKEP